MAQPAERQVDKIMGMSKLDENEMIPEMLRGNMRGGLFPKTEQAAVRFIKFNVLLMAEKELNELLAPTCPFRIQSIEAIPSDAEKARLKDSPPPPSSLPLPSSSASASSSPSSSSSSSSSSSVTLSSSSPKPSVSSLPSQDPRSPLLKENKAKGPYTSWPWGMLQSQAQLIFSERWIGTSCKETVEFRINYFKDLQGDGFYCKVIPQTFSGWLQYGMNKLRAKVRETQGPGRGG